MNKNNFKMTIYFQNKKQKLKKQIKIKKSIKQMEEISNNKKSLMNNQKMKLKNSKNDNFLNLLFIIYIFTVHF